MSDSTQEQRKTLPEPSSPMQPDSDGAGTIFFGPDGLRAGWSLLLFAVVYLLIQTGLVELAAAAGFRPHGSAPQSAITPQFALVDEALNAGAVLLATLVMTKIERRGPGCFGLARPHWSRRLVEGAGWGLLLISVLVGGLRGAGLLVFDGRELHGAQYFGFGAVWLLSFCLVAIYEELFFRGYLQATLSRGLGSLYRLLGMARFREAGFWTSAVILSFGFGLVHTTNPGESRVGVFAAGTIGVVFCLSLWRTGALWWAIGFHAAWDWGESYLYGAYDSGLLIRGRLFATHPQGRLDLSGGLTGPEGSLLILPILLFATAAIVLTLRPSQTTSAAKSADLACSD